MHTSVIQSPQAMSNDRSYRPRSPDLPGISEQLQSPQTLHHQQPPRLSRLPSYQIQEPSLPRGHSFSPRGSYDASPFFTQPLSQASNPQFTDSYPAQSPPRFDSASQTDQPQVFSPISYNEPQQLYQPPNPAENSSTQFEQYPPHSLRSYQAQFDEMARLRSRKPVNYDDDHNGASYEEPIPTYPPPQQLQQMPPQTQPQQFMQQPPPPQFMQQQMPQQVTFSQPLQQPVQQPVQPIMQQPQPLPSTAASLPPVDVKTKFPVARIKRIMQADEDVGKVAQATPTAVSKALEMFMIALVTKGATEATRNNSKRVTATHLKHALLTDPQFDFLNEICASVPDDGGKASKGRAKSEAKSEDSDEEMASAPKKKARASRKKKSGDDDGSD